MTILTQDGMCSILDAIARGDQIAEAAATASLSEAGLWTAKRQSRLAEQEFDTTRFWIEWQGHLNFFHVLLDVAAEGRTGRGRGAAKPAVTEWDPDEKPPYARGLKTPATPEAVARYIKPRPSSQAASMIDPQRPFPPTPTPASPRVRPDSPLVRDLMARAAVAPSNPHPLDSRGNRTVPHFGAGSPANDPEEKIGA